MTYHKTALCLLMAIFFPQCGLSANGKNSNGQFPEEIVHFVPYQKNPVFEAAGATTGTATWDMRMRERGYILKEESGYSLWYTGYTYSDSIKYLGYATSSDGITWTRYPDNPIYSSNWVEDMCVVKDNGTYYMFAEGKDDVAHILVSTDRIHWLERGNLDIRLANNKPIKKGPYGTPTVWKERDTWYLFYERDDSGIWLATSKDLNIWTNIQDEPVLKLGPEHYDQYAMAMNQVIKYKGLYYGYYHASAFKDWHEWSTNVAVSSDLVHWQKYELNPILRNNKSSGILVHDGLQYRLYTMHPEVNLYFPVANGAR